MKIIELRGCAPAPLASYLKATAVFRLVAEQLDPDVRAWWDGDRFMLASRYTEEDLSSFFASSWAPTPIIGPWNKGSGFLGKTQDPVVKEIEGSTAPRFAALRDGVAAAQANLAALAEADRAVRRIKDETKERTLSKAAKEALKNSEDYKRRLAAAEKKFKSLKANMIPALRREWRGRHREWLDAALVIGADQSVKFPSLLGTGGNDGRLDFTLKFLQILRERFDLGSALGEARQGTMDLIRASLFGEAICAVLGDYPAGQFFPAAAGGANSSNGPSADGRVNPIDLLLFLEGAVCFTSSATQRFDGASGARVAAPFALSPQAFGYASAGLADEAARGEQWMPLWSNPTSIADFRRMLAEGRAQIGGTKAQEPLELARAAARLGVVRGISGFKRYGYIERNGQSNFAVPLSRVQVSERALPELFALDDIEPWMRRLRRVARDKGAPARLVAAERALVDAVVLVVQHVDEPARWQSVMLAMADIEEVQLHGAGRKAGAIPKLRPQWALAADDGSAEFRLALAFALQRDVRRHWLSRENGKFVDGRADRVMQGRSGVDDAIAVVERRLVEGAQRGSRSLPLFGRGVFASRFDLARLLSGDVDLDRCLRLARAVMAIDQDAWRAEAPPIQRAPRVDWPDDAWLALRVSLVPWPLPDGRAPRADPAILRRLESGDASAAVQIALRRLRLVGISCGFATAAMTPAQARLFAAALAFPISKQTAQAFADRLDPASAMSDLHSTENAA
jgi:CRISPR-associated protein Csx17